VDRGFDLSCHFRGWGMWCHVKGVLIFLRIQVLFEVQYNFGSMVECGF
jgi:hypothetical protein